MAPFAQLGRVTGMRGSLASSTSPPQQEATSSVFRHGKLADGQDVVIARLSPASHHDPVRSNAAQPGRGHTACLNSRFPRRGSSSPGSGCALDPFDPTNGAETQTGSHFGFGIPMLLSLDLSPEARTSVVTPSRWFGPTALRSFATIAFESVRRSKPSHPG